MKKEQSVLEQTSVSKRSVSLQNKAQKFILSQ